MFISLRDGLFKPLRERSQESSLSLAATVVAGFSVIVVLVIIVIILTSTPAQLLRLHHNHR